MHVYDNNGRRETINSLFFGVDAKIWDHSMSNELGILNQGNKHGIRATDTIDFISQKDVPVNNKVTYANFVCDYRPLKLEMHRIRLVVGEINYRMMGMQDPRRHH